MKKTVLILLAIVGVVGAFALYYIAQGFMDAARHGGSPAARERRLSAISREQNVGLPKKYGEGTVMIATKAGPGLRFTYVFQLVNVTSTNVDAAALAAKARSKLTEIYKTNPEAANFRKWEVELFWQYLDKDGSEITTIAVTPKDL
jgi:hypothetical protein